MIGTRSYPGVRERKYYDPDQARDPGGKWSSSSGSGGKSAHAKVDAELRKASLGGPVKSGTFRGKIGEHAKYMALRQMMGVKGPAFRGQGTMKAKEGWARLREGDTETVAREFEGRRDKESRDIMRALKERA